MWFGKIRKDIVIVFVIVIVIVTISRFRCDLDQERYCRTNYYFYSQSHGEYRMSWAQHLEKHEVVEIQFCKKELSRLRPDFLFSPPHWLPTWKLTMATWVRCWRKSKIYSSVFLADPWHQRDDRPVLRWVSAASAPGARRRLPWCLCCSPWKPDRGIKQDHRKGWSFVAHAYRWLFMRK